MATYAAELQPARFTPATVTQLSGRQWPASCAVGDAALIMRDRLTPDLVGTRVRIVRLAPDCAFELNGTQMEPAPDARVYWWIVEREDGKPFPTCDDRWERFAIYADPVLKLVERAAKTPRRSPRSSTTRSTVIPFPVKRDAGRRRETPANEPS